MILLRQRRWRRMLPPGRRLSSMTSSLMHRPPITKEQAPSIRKGHLIKRGDAEEGARGYVHGYSETLHGWQLVDGRPPVWLMWLDILHAPDLPQSGG
jgi:hypothetical protein